MASRGERIVPIVEPIVAALGYTLYAVAIEPALSRVVLRIYIDRPEGVNITDCQQVSRQVSAVLDVENIMPGAYVLEVSSPGLDRPLLEPQHFAASAGKKAKFRVRESVGSKRSYVGILQGLDGSDVLVLVDDEILRFPLATIEKAHLIPELFKR
jgi:ribosome maturation factor RimP